MPTVLNKWNQACEFGLGLARSFLFLRDRALAGGRQGSSHEGLFTKKF